MYLCPCCLHSLGFLSLYPVSVLSWRQKTRTHEQGNWGFGSPSGGVNRLLPRTGSHSPYSWQACLFPSGSESPSTWDPCIPYHFPPATLRPVRHDGGGLHAGMSAGVPAAVRVPGQDAVIAGAIAGTAGQWQLDDSTRSPHIEAMLRAREDS